MSTTDPTPDPSDSDLGESGKRALAAERKRADTAERQLAALRTELTTAQAQIVDLTTAAESSATENAQALASKDLMIARLNVGIDKGLSRPLINRLQGDDQAGLESDADELLSLMPPAPGGATPRPDPSQGHRAPAITTPKDAFAAALGPLMNP